ncbi:glycoside hydrolase family 13 protein [Lactococcus termiticola]|uniref:Alpha-amylase n=1 Tax=Lactococcus termiticola TaxID=2169526 RepID=A0A2R5HIL0_9LACT|nr:glycoside hydrolase family 13 protein [Lactococcus termiticola]GBG97425.1 alpha-amylase [Lactococcus termiticola]
MNTAAIYHRPESEFAFLYKVDEVRIRIRTAIDDAAKVELIYADPYDFSEVMLSNGDSSGATPDWQFLTIEMQKVVTTESHDYYQVAVDLAHKRMDYLFVITGQEGEKVVLTDRGAMPYDIELLTKKYAAFRLPFFHEVDRFKAPDWVKDTVWYQIFPERFANGDKSLDPENVKAWDPTETPEREDFYGGDLQGVLDHLDHLAELGVNGIYFTPVFKAPTNHKYDTQDYLEIDPHFGDKALFKKLIDEAHARGIKVMIDAVFNHIGDESPQWQDVLKNQEKSKYADWFHINKFPASYVATDNNEFAVDATYETFAFTPHMPKLNTANPEVIDYLLHITTYWIKAFDIDAWRLDVADEIDHTFWKKFRKACDEVKKDFYILGEVWHSSQPWLVGDEFSAVMNYAYTGAIADSIVKGKTTLTQMVAALNTQLMLYRDQTNQVMFNVLDSHDTPRLLTECEEDKDLMKQVEAFTYLQPGVPCIYYGDEYAVTGGGDPACRKVMPWTAEHQDQEMFAFFKALVAFRKENSKLLSECTMDWCVVSDENGVIQLQRKLGEDVLIGTFNTGKKAVDGELKDLMLSNLATIDGKNVSIAPNGFAISKG